MRNLPSELVDQILSYLTIDEIKICLETHPMFKVLSGEKEFEVKLSEQTFYNAYMTEGRNAYTTDGPYKYQYDTYHAGVFRNLRDAVKGLFVTVLKERHPPPIFFPGPEEIEESDLLRDDKVANYIRTICERTGRLLLREEDIDIDYIAELLTDMIDFDHGFDRTVHMVVNMCEYNYQNNCVYSWLADTYYNDGWNVTLVPTKIQC